MPIPRYQGEGYEGRDSVFVNQFNPDGNGPVNKNRRDLSMVYLVAGIIITGLIIGAYQSDYHGFRSHIESGLEKIGLDVRHAGNRN